MGIVEQATRRLEELSRAGVAVPWGAAGLAHSELQARVEAGRLQPPADPSPVASMRRIDEHLAALDASAARRKIDSANEPACVTIDLERLERSGHLVPAQTRSPLAEEFRYVKRPLLKNARSLESATNRLSLIMVTSALPGEGKTFCAINLAMSMAAEIDTSVLLVDADAARPEIPQRLGIEPRRGLFDLLADPALSLSDVLLKTNVPKLDLLPAGTRSELSTELLASEAMDVLLESLAGMRPHRVVVFDAPPLLVTNEAKVLASRIGQVVMVVAASVTSRNAVAQAFAAVEQCPIVLSVLNRAREPAVRLGYGYYEA